MPRQNGGRLSRLRRPAIAFCLIGLGAAAPMEPGLHTTVTFEQPSPLASTAEIVRRTFSPLTAQRIAATNAIAGQPIDIAQESFLVYVPEPKPPEGYALLVFVPPWNVAKLPSGWAPVLDEKGIVFVSAAQSGNDAKVESRRMPLAVTAATNLMKEYGIDPTRVLVGGFSGGSRVALRLALAYPDVFRGALLNSDSDPVGTSTIPLPPADLLHQFQERSRIYYLSGDLDLGSKSMQAASEASLQKWCVFDTRGAMIPHAGHTTADERILSLALDTLLDPTPAKHDGLAECRARVQSELVSDVQHINALIVGGDKAAARQALNDLDAKFGGLAADQTHAVEEDLARGESGFRNNPALPQ